MKISEGKAILNYKGVIIRCADSSIPWFEINLAGMSLPYMETIEACGKHCEASSLALGKMYNGLWRAKLAIRWYQFLGYKAHNGQLFRTKKGEEI